MLIRSGHEKKEENLPLCSEARRTLALYLPCHFDQSVVTRKSWVMCVTDLEIKHAKRRSFINLLLLHDASVDRSPPGEVQTREKRASAQSSERIEVPRKPYHSTVCITCTCLPCQLSVYLMT